MTSIEVTMELEEHPNKRFMAKYDRYEPKIKDSHAIQQVKVCPRKYFLQIVLAFQSKEKPPYFEWGTAYHKFRETLEREYGFGHNKPKVYDPDKARESFTVATNVGVNYWRKNGRDQDVNSKYGYMTTNRLMQSFVAAFKHWETEKKQGRIEVIAIEQAFNVKLEDGSYTSGRADQIIRWNGKAWGRDFKTSSQDREFFSRRLEPNDQFTRYTVAEGKLTGEIVQGQFIEVLYNAKSTKNKENGPEVYTLTTSRTAYQLAQFEKEQATINDVLEVYRKNDVWPQHESSCPFCPFHSVCTKPTEAGMMAQLEAHFDIRPWDNTKVGVD